MEVRNVTHEDAVWGSPDEPIAEVAAVMRAADVSAVLAGEDDRVIGMNECSQQRPEEYPDSPPPPPEYPFRHPDERPDQSPIETPPLEPERVPDPWPIETPPPELRDSGTSSGSIQEMS